MSTIKAANIQNPSAASAAIVLDTSGNVNIDSNTLYVDATNNRIGINGITSPNYVTHIKQGGQDALGLEASSNDSRLIIGNTGSTWRFTATYGSTGSYQPITFNTSDTERLRITSNGTLQLFNSPGIDFSQIQTNAAGMSSETLDSYEEGTWTPQMKFGGNSVGISYTEQYGVYVKIGQMLWIQVTIALSSKGSSNGQLTIEGLPFTLSNVTGSRGGGSFQTINGGAGINGLPAIYGGQNVTYLEVYQMSGTPGSQVNVAQVNESNITNGFAMRACGVFRTAS